MSDHVHMMISIPAKYAVVQVIGYIIRFGPPWHGCRDKRFEKPWQHMDRGRKAYCRDGSSQPHRLVQWPGIDDVIYTHISLSVFPTTMTLLGNPLGLRFEEVNASNLVAIDIHCNIVTTLLRSIPIRGCFRFIIHSAIQLTARRDDLPVDSYTAVSLAV